MALSTAIYTLLHNNATIEAVVGDRIYPGIAPFNVSLPCIVVQVGNIEPDRNQTSDLNWDKADINVIVMSLFYTDSETYAKNVRTALSRYSGTVDGENIDTIIYEGQEPQYFQNQTESGTPVGTGEHHRVVKFTAILKG